MTNSLVIKKERLSEVTTYKAYKTVKSLVFSTINLGVINKYYICLFSTDEQGFSVLST